jgi:paraquat-inducible protein B
MKKPVNPAAIGIFIAGAIVILFVSLVVFGGGRYFRKTRQLLLTFREPAAGLEAGAPVKIAGVTVGSVEDISIEVDKHSTNGLLINVIIKIDRANAQARFRDYPLSMDDRTLFERTVTRMGLRGQLDVLNLLSGQLYVALDLFPGQEGFQLHREQEHGFWEIPTLPSTKSQLMRSLVTSLDNFTQFDFKGTSEELKLLLHEVRTEVAQLELDKTSASLSETLARVNELLGNPHLKSAVTNLDDALAQIHQLGSTLNAQANPLLAQLDADLKKAGAMFDGATQTLRQLQAQVEPGSALSRELVRALEEAGLALNALRHLAQEIERNPSSLIAGKKEKKP